MEVDDLFIDLKLNYKNEDEMKLFDLSEDDKDQWPENVSNLSKQHSKKQKYGSKPEEPKSQISPGTVIDTMPLFLTSKY